MEVPRRSITRTMVKNLLFCLLPMFFLTCCHSKIGGKGLVVDATTKRALPNVRISILQIDSTITDSDGKFDFFTLLIGGGVDQIILLNSDGYEPRLYKLEDGFNLIEMKPQTGVFRPLVSQNTVEVFYQINKFLITGINLLTFAIILVLRRRKWRFFHIISILLLNVKLGFSYLNGEIIHFQVISSPIQIEHYWRYPFTIMLIVPIGTIIFWIFYFIKPSSIADK